LRNRVPHCGGHRSSAGRRHLCVGDFPRFLGGSEGAGGRTGGASVATGTTRAIPDTVKEKPQEGEVIGVGPGARDESGKLIGGQTAIVASPGMKRELRLRRMQNGFRGASSAYFPTLVPRNASA
jgi:hypothetical protein